MKFRNAFILTALFFVLTACGASIDDVKEGMTESEVEELLGSPNHKNSTSNSYSVNGETESHEVATWKYDGTGTVEFENGLVVRTSK